MKNLLFVLPMFVIKKQKVDTRGFIGSSMITGFLGHVTIVVYLTSMALVNVSP